MPLAIDPGTPPHIFSFSWSYELPFGRDKAFLSGDSGIVSAIVSGWRFSGALRYQSGAALAITATNNLAPLGYEIKYANRVEGVDVYKDARDGFDPATDRYLNAAAFAAPAAFALGNTGGPLGYVRGFAQKSEALSLARTFNIGNHRLDVGLDVAEPVQLRALERPQHEHLVRRAVRIGHRHAGRENDADQLGLQVLTRFTDPET